MTEQNPEQPAHQDPADPNKVDTGVETTDQPEPATPAEPNAVEVAPSDPNVKTDKVFGKDYEVTAERGYRRS